MKSKKLLLLEKILRWMASKILNKYKPKIVAVTGSVGKSTTKEMVYQMLSNFFQVRTNIKNYNNEVGLPLSIIGAASGGKSILGWMGVFLKWLRLWLLPAKYPQILVLEMGADQPGDIQYLCEYVPVDVGIITNIGISHLENFKTKKAVAKEKTQLVKCLPTGGLAVLNFDDTECRKAATSLKSNVISYGFAPDAAMKASDVFFGYEKQSTSTGDNIQLLRGISFKLNYQGKIIPVRLNNCLGRPQIYSALAAFSVAVYFNLNLVEAAQALSDFRPYPGRLSLIAGIKNTILIDDTYNSAPDSVKVALEAVRQIKAARKIVALGDMLELGEESESAHQQVGQWVAEGGVDLLVTVGKRMHAAAMEFAKVSNRPDLVMEFDNPIDAGVFIQDVIKPGDLVLVKGSQGLRMEKIMEELMNEPEQKEKLLVRQDKKWQEKPYQMP